MTIRTAEKKLINAFIDDSDKNVFFLYGRKGMGKSTLLKDVAAEREALFFTAYPTTGDMEAAMLSECLGQEQGSDEEIALKGVLDTLLKKVQEKSDVTVFIIDNYQDFVKADTGFNDTLAEAMNSPEARKSLKLILGIDSYVSAERYVFDRKSPWKEEFLERCEMKELSFEQVYKALDEMKDADPVFTYGLTGGIPSYVEAVREAGAHDKESQIRACFGNSARNASHPEEIMHQELRELAYYNRMLSTLAKGVARVNEISAIVKKPKDIVVPYLKTLMSFNIVKKENPITEKGNRRKTRYSIVNDSDLFWYRFIAPHYYKAFNSPISMQDIDDKELSLYEKDVFQNICAQYLMRESKMGKLPFVLDEVGNWWENNDEEHTTEGFDLVGLGETGETPVSVFCNVYYFDKEVEIQELKALIELTKRVKRKGDNFYMIFSKSGFNDHALTVASAIKNIILIDLDTILKSYLTEKE